MIRHRGQWRSAYELPVVSPERLGIDGWESKLRGVWEWGQVGLQVVPAILVQLRCAAPVGGPEGGQSR